MWDKSFQEHGLTLRDYLRVAVKVPPFFYQKPEK
jgi:hypothetical protein